MPFSPSESVELNLSPEFDSWFQALDQLFDHILAGDIDDDIHVFRRPRQSVVVVGESSG
jgi:hypothetical protein